MMNPCLKNSLPPLRLQFRNANWFRPSKLGACLVSVLMTAGWAHAATGDASIARAALQPPPVILDPSADRHGDVVRLFQGIPGIERAPNGRLWATWYANNVEADEGPDNYVVLVTSADDGATWSAPVLAVDPGGPVRAFDPVLWIDPNGRMWLFWSQAHTFWDGRGGVWAVTTDNPEAARPTWSPSRRLFNGVMMNKPTVLSNGDWIAPAAVWKREVRLTGRRAISDERAIALTPDEMYSNVLRSRDDGESWSLAGQADVAGRTFDEHMFVERNDGSLWMLVRTNYGIGESFSTDGGVTWTQGRESGIDHVSARFFIRRLASGRLLLIKHSPPEENRRRSHLTAFLSDDDGKNWKGGLLLDERFGVSYPDAVETEDGMIYAIYDYDRAGERKILLAVFTEKDVLAGETVTPGARLRVTVNQAD